MRKLIFVGGIHGVGKSTFCKEVSIKHNLKYFSASQLISKLKNQEFSKNKRVSNIKGNQDLLIEALNINTTEDDWIILDGHFCLLNKAGKITRIPEVTYNSLLPSAIIIITDEVSKISFRLKERENINFDNKFLDSFQNEELIYSKEVSKKLNTPHFIYNEQVDMGVLNKFIRKIINNYH